MKARLNKLSVLAVIINCIMPAMSLIFTFQEIYAARIPSVSLVEYNSSIPQLSFAAQELKDAMTESDRGDFKVTLKIKPDKDSPEAFQIRILNPARIEVTASDANGAMYGGLEIADRLRLGIPIENKSHKPFIKKRGIKFNIPLDARTPSYDDTGDNAQRNIETVWDFQFWKAYLDDLARYRYNVLSLWTTHPYPSIIKLKDYPDVALDDVYRISEGIFQPHHKNRLQDVDLNKPGTMTLVKKISIEDKVKHWQRVFQYAEDRGIEIYLFHWNVMTFGATAKHGITPEQTNPVTVDYMRKSVRQALLTYPQISGIGVTAGENADNHLKGEYSIENFLFNTYGRAVIDVKKLHPDRKVRFIFRQHMSGLGPITKAFADFPDEFNTSFKYAIGHMYTVRKPLLFDRGFRREVEQYKVPCWLNLRNDDMFVLRWGSPDYVRDYIQNMPHDVMAGFYMGSDGYVWARETIAKNPQMAGRLEINKHWYRFRQWGQLAYNPDLSRGYWHAVLKKRFGDIDAAMLYDAWASISEIVPQLNALCFKPNDAHLAPEGCIERKGFLTVDGYFLDPQWYKPIAGSQIISIKDWAQAVVYDKKLNGTTPLQVADNLDKYSAAAMAALPKLRKKMSDNIELAETLNDIESMAYLGRYYADKIRGAAKLEVFRRNIRKKELNAQAVAHLKDAVDEWKAYTSIMSSQYKPQLMARTHYMDWNSITKEVEKEVVTVAREGDYPEIRFTNLTDGATFPAQTDLSVKLDASDKDGIREVKLYLNGLLLDPENSKQNYVWSYKSDQLLKALKPGIYQLMAVAEDKTGIFAQHQIHVVVGNASHKTADHWKDDIYQVILNEGEYLKSNEKIKFVRLECDLKINEDGRLVLHGVIPGKTSDYDLLWKASMYKDHQGSNYAILKNGQLMIHRGKPGNPEATPFKTPAVSGPGPYKLGITRARKLVIFSEVKGKKRTIVWKSN